MNTTTLGQLLPYKTVDVRRPDGGETLHTAGEIERYLRTESPSPNYPFSVRYGKCRVYLQPGYTPWWKMVSVDAGAEGGERSFCGASSQWSLRDVIARGVAKAANGGTIGDDGLSFIEPLPSDSFLDGLARFAEAFGITAEAAQ